MKCCNKCKINKPLNEFSKDKYKNDGLQYKCKLCSRVDNKQWQNNMSAVYGIYDNDKVLYVGKSTGINGRWALHKSCLKNQLYADKHLKSVASLYPLLRSHFNVEFRIIEEVSRGVLLQREKYYINALKPLYNIHK
jgi:hypothetical protein